MLSSLSIPSRFTYQSLFLSLNINQKKTSSQLFLQLAQSFPVNTCDLPQTFDLIKTHCPSVLMTECFNDQNLPFSQELLSTEVGHLFEHLLLEYLCLERMKQGASDAVFNGRTSWNWQRYQPGSFHIFIDAGINHSSIFQAALDQSLKLTEMVLSTHLSNPKTTDIPLSSVVSPFISL